MGAPAATRFCATRTGAGAGRSGVQPAAARTGFCADIARAAGPCFVDARCAA